MEKQESYIKLIRIRYHQKIFDIFGDKNHQKTFLEVRIENGKEVYYYPILKDYIGLNNIYNKPFNGVLNSKKYSFQSKVMIATYMMGISLIIGQGLTINNLNYELQRIPVTYEPLQESNSISVEEKTQQPEIEQLKIEEEKDSFSLEDIDPSMYCQDESKIMVYDNEVLTALGVPEVSFEEAHLTLDNNTKISPEHKKYMHQFLNVLEKKMPEVDLRILNSNWKDLEYAIDLDQEGEVNGSWSMYDKKLHLKKEYINSETGTFDEKRFISVLAHELVHTLNYGTLTITDPNTLEEITLTKFFQRTNYGESFSEGFTTILANYLLSDDYENYFEQENPSFSSYQETTPICYQIYKGMDNYNMYDFIDKDISYFSQKVSEEGLEDAVLVVDTYYESLEGLEEGDILETEELDQLLEEVLEKRIEKEVEKGSSNLKILSIVDKIPSEDYNIDKWKVTREILKGREDNVLYILSDQEKNAGLTEEEQLQKGYATVRISRGEEKEPLNITPKMITIYLNEQNGIPEYRFAYLTLNQEYHDVETEEVVQLEFENSLGLFQVLPEMDVSIQTTLLKDPDFIKLVEEELEEKREEAKRYQEQYAQREQAKAELRNKLDPLINEAISIGAGDLELCRIVTENSESLTLGMEILQEYKPESLIIFKNSLSKTEEMTITTLSVIHSDGTLSNDNEIDNYIIYQTEGEEGINYHLGKLVEENGESHLYDDRGNLVTNPVNLENTYSLKEVLPDIGTYSIQVKEEFFSSPEFRSLMDAIQNEKGL